jgi:hypothetical protein
MNKPPQSFTKGERVALFTATPPTYNLNFDQTLRLNADSEISAKGFQPAFKTTADGVKFPLPGMTV